MRLSGAITPDKSGPWNDGNKEVLHIPQISSITETSPSDFFTIIFSTLVGEFYSSAEMQSVYSATPADWATTAKFVQGMT